MTKFSGESPVTLTPESGGDPEVAGVDDNPREEARAKAMRLAEILSEFGVFIEDPQTFNFIVNSERSEDPGRDNENGFVKIVYTMKPEYVRNPGNRTDFARKVPRVPRGHRPVGPERL